MWLRSRIYDSNGQLRVDNCVAATLLFASLRQNDGPGVTSPWKGFSLQLGSKIIRIAHDKFYMSYALDSSGNVGFNCLTVDREHQSTKVQGRENTTASPRTSSSSCFPPASPSAISISAL